MSRRAWRPSGSTCCPSSRAGDSGTAVGQAGDAGGGQLDGLIGRPRKHGALRGVEARAAGRPVVLLGFGAVAAEHGPEAGAAAREADGQAAGLHVALAVARWARAGLVTHLLVGGL